MRILIATGIYPPELGGPALYAENLEKAWSKAGHEVSVKVFSRFSSLPTGFRHLAYFFHILPAARKADFIFVLDTFSAALPSIWAAKFFNKKVILRTGGDFLWEAYVERTGDLVLLKDFYKKRLSKLSPKEKRIFKLIKYVLKNTAGLVWSTEWQKEIFSEPYELKGQNHFIVENYYGPKLHSEEPESKNFLAASRKLKWKNIPALERVFEEREVKNSGAILDTKALPHEDYLAKLQRSYAVIIASLGDISPNTILDSIRCNKPFILTAENGLFPRIKDIGLYADPLSRESIKEKVLWLLNPDNYAQEKAKIEAFTFIHTWEEMAEEYLAIYNTLK